ncbi:uncharacterized protein RCO7_06536 [Rhynchosporium graminicola]|uniref:Uncharacterized protein n=1 Tax=Rhynchosporium graminicola TaxID=2792576 RepID=A0A1E1KA64_9HELO|nr:uncharacterized protein RCO7_06536 [Rhynchosporium commune]
MSIFNSLLWREVTPGCYERGIDEAEQFYTSMAKTWEATGHTYFAITACTGISISESPVSGGSSLDARVEAAFRWGWKKMRYDHPTLAAPTQYDHHSKRCKKVYKTLRNEQELEMWMDETFKVIDTEQTGEDFANTDPPAGRYATLFLISQSDHCTSDLQRVSWDIVFRCHHDLVDGIGTLMLLNNLLHHAAEAFESSTEQGIAFGDEHKNLSPPLRIAAGIPIAPSVDQLAKLARIQSTNKAARIGKCVLGVPFSPDAEAPGSSQRSAIHFSPQESSSVVAKSKLFQSTMTQILHTAIALAIRDLQPKTSEAYEARYFSYSLVNLRHCCVPPYHKPRHAASVYHCVSANHLVVDLTVPAESIATHDQSLEEFQSTLGQVRDFYNNAKIDADYLSIVPSLFSIVTPKYPSTTSDIPAPNQSPSVSLSSEGIVDRIVQPKQGSFEILEPWVVGAEYSTGIGAFLGTWNGALCLSAGYNEAFHSKAKVLDFLESVKRIVLDGLELDHSHVETELQVIATS